MTSKEKLISNNINQITYLNKHVRAGDTITFWCMNKHDVCLVETKVLYIYPTSDIPPPFLYLTVEPFSLLDLFTCYRIYLTLGFAEFYPQQTFRSETRDFVFVLKCLDDFWYQSITKMAQLSPKSHLEALRQFFIKKMEMSFIDLRSDELLWLIDSQLAFVLYDTIDTKKMDDILETHWGKYRSELEIKKNARRFAVMTRQKQTLKRVYYVHELVEIESLSTNVFSVLGGDEKFSYQSKKYQREKRQFGRVFYTFERDKKVVFESPFLIPIDKKEMVENFISRNNKQINDRMKVIFDWERKIESCIEQDRATYEENRNELVELSKNVIDEMHAGWIEKEGLKSFNNNT